MYSICIVYRDNIKATLVNRSCKFALSHLYMHISLAIIRAKKRAIYALRKSRRRNRVIIARFCVTVMIYCLLMCAHTWVRFNLYGECDQPRLLSRRFATMRLLTLMCVLTKALVFVIWFNYNVKGNWVCGRKAFHWIQRIPRRFCHF